MRLAGRGVPELSDMTAYGGSDSPACRAAVEVAQELGIAVKDLS